MMLGCETGGESSQRKRTCVSACVFVYMLHNKDQHMHFLKK